jgi:hypothetical protein
VTRSRTLPTFIVIGAMKAGTTSLYHYLREHPQIFMPKAKELDFFAVETTWRRGIDWYAEQFAGAGGDEIARGEASTAYSKYPHYPNVPERIARAIPGCQLIYVVRLPLPTSGRRRGGTRSTGARGPGEPHLPRLQPVRAPDRPLPKRLSAGATARRGVRAPARRSCGDHAADLRVPRGSHGRPSAEPRQRVLSDGGSPHVSPRRLDDQTCGPPFGPEREAGEGVRRLDRAPPVLQAFRIGRWWEQRLGGPASRPPVVDRVRSRAPRRGPGATPGTPRAGLHRLGAAGRRR